MIIYKRNKRGLFFAWENSRFWKKGGNSCDGIREKGGEIGNLEHEYVPFLGPSGGAGVCLNGIELKLAW